LEVVIVFVGAVVSAVVLGYLAGLLSFKVKSRWCPQCGATTLARDDHPMHKAAAK
jgi:hypothetical protein